MKTLTTVNLKWLAEVAEQKPTLFSIVLLLIAVGVMATVIVNRDIKIDKCAEEKRAIQTFYERKLDSTNIANQIERREAKEEVKAILSTIIEDSKDALEEQKALNQSMKTTIKQSSAFVKKNRRRIKNSR